jgi:ketosteroid isomerase-like protein
MLVLLTIATTIASVRAETKQTAQVETLHDKIVALDKALFDAFNNCDIEAWKSYLAIDIEFYQDNDDPTTTRAELEPFFKDRCGPDNVQTLRRELLLESVEVHPIQGYGAVQFGAHSFWVVMNEGPDQLAATPKFVHLWRNSDGVWQITRVISYGH